MGASNKGDFGARTLSRDLLKDLIKDGRIHVAVGVVTKFDGEPSHYELDGEDLLLDVKLMPEGQPVLCRVASCVGGPGRGIWAIPPVGTEVVVGVPLGELDADPVILGYLSSGDLPAGVDEVTIVVASPSVKIVADRVVLGPNPDLVIDALDGFVHGRGIDSLTGLPYSQLGSTSSKVVGNK